MLVKTMNLDASAEGKENYIVAITPKDNEVALCTVPGNEYGVLLEDYGDGTGSVARGSADGVDGTLVDVIASVQLVAGDKVEAASTGKAAPGGTFAEVITGATANNLAKVKLRKPVVKNPSVWTQAMVGLRGDHSTSNTSFKDLLTCPFTIPAKGGRVHLLAVVTPRASTSSTGGRFRLTVNDGAIPGANAVDLNLAAYHSVSLAGMALDLLPGEHVAAVQWRVLSGLGPMDCDVDTDPEQAGAWLMVTVTDP